MAKGKTEMPLLMRIFTGERMTSMRLPERTAVAECMRDEIHRLSEQYL